MCMSQNKFLCLLSPKEDGKPIVVFEALEEVKLFTTHNFSVSEPLLAFICVL